MTLPRFNSGNVGKLTFDQLNEMFDTVERLKPLLLNGAPAASGESVLLARIISSNTNGAHQWQEIVPAPATTAAQPYTWKDRVGGAKSSTAQDTAYDPAFVIESFTWNGASPAPTQLAAGSVVVLRKTRREDGKQAWVIVNGVSSGGVWAAKITNSTLTALTAGCPAGQTLQAWLYDWSEVHRDAATGMEWVASGRTSATTGKARNGAERGCISGVGGAPPANVSESNQAIANDVVVAMSLDSNGKPFFSLSNDRFITCT